VSPPLVDSIVHCDVTSSTTYACCGCCSGHQKAASVVAAVAPSPGGISVSVTAVRDMQVPLPLPPTAGESPVREPQVAFKVLEQSPLGWQLLLWLKLLLLCIVNLFTFPDSEMKMGEVLRALVGGNCFAQVRISFLFCSLR